MEKYVLFIMSCIAVMITVSVPANAQQTKAAKEKVAGFLINYLENEKIGEIGLDV